MTDPITPHIADADERRIVTKLVGLLLKEGMQLRVFDGEDYATSWTTDAATILGNIAHTDEAHLMVQDQPVCSLQLERHADGALKEVARVCFVIRQAVHVSMTSMPCAASIDRFKR